MADRDPLHDPRAGDVIYVNGVVRTIIYTSAYGKVFYKNSAGVRKKTELNSESPWRSAACIAARRSTPPFDER